MVWLYAVKEGNSYLLSKKERGLVLLSGASSKCVYKFLSNNL